MNKLDINGIDFGSENLEIYTPEVSGNFCVWLNLTIGLENIDGGDLFQVGICTTSWLEHQTLAKDFYIPRHMIIVNEFDYKLIKSTIDEIISSAERPTWEQSLQILCRFFSWEYEDYQS
ncbi:Imm8 family immunity protein [Comamonas thiooxydans]|uniref:Imm8 family immunity protein n=1 Tax=Comamonas thiooxydans TaxID=363952 RepID=UPI0009B86B74|nr:Imm8 family immunity protein [Comamonas thiooxydans]MCO8251929.1 immunity 8 family protein [Comamonas thiooxydans]